MEKLRVLLVGYEAAPFFKRGGLGDVLGSLPKALSKLGIDARVIIPYYKDLKNGHAKRKIGTFSVVFGGKIEQVGIYQEHLPQSRVPIYFLENKRHLSVINTRGRNKKIDQFAFFDLAVCHFLLWAIEDGKWTADIVHCNDWHTGLVPLILNRKLKLAIPTLLTIHNGSYQGKGSQKVLDLLHLKDEDTKELKRGTPITQINILGEGIIHASVVSTVSNSYALEIANGNGRDPIHSFLLKRHKEQGKKDQVLGIINGIDYDIWDPEKDPHISSNFSISNWKKEKNKNKSELLFTLGLPDRPTFCFIGRMTRQKGIDVLLKKIGTIVSLNVNILFLGTGEKKIEKSVAKAASENPGNIKANFVYDEEHAHKLYASSDFIIIPSRFEPCGLIQMIAMRYGTIPIASETGGLSDTIENGKNGFLFKAGSSSFLFKSIEKALRIYKTDEYEKMVENAMKTDFSWGKNAEMYKILYKEIIDSYDPSFLTETPSL